MNRGQHLVVNLLLRVGVLRWLRPTPGTVFLVPLRLPLLQLNQTLFIKLGNLRVRPIKILQNPLLFPSAAKRGGGSLFQQPFQLASPFFQNCDHWALAMMARLPRSAALVDSRNHLVSYSITDELVLHHRARTGWDQLRVLLEAL